MATRPRMRQFAVRLISILAVTTLDGSCINLNTTPRSLRLPFGSLFQRGVGTLLGGEGCPETGLCTATASCSEFGREA